MRIELVELPCPECGEPLEQHPKKMTRYAGRGIWTDASVLLMCKNGHKGQLKIQFVTDFYFRQEVTDRARKLLSETPPTSPAQKNAPEELKHG